MEDSEKKKEIDFKKSPKFLRLFKYLKNQYVDLNINEYNTRLLFDLQVFMVILFLFTTIKTSLSLFYFFFLEKVFFNLNILLIIFQLLISFVLTKQNIIYSKFQKQELTMIEIGMKYLFILVFCLEENMSIYYFNNVTFDLNPVFIYFIINLILFFDVKNVKKFNETLIGLYVMNFFFLMYFFSVKNLMNFFLPINLVIFIFALINIISQNFNKKILTMQVIHRFLEEVVENLCNFNEFSIVYRGRCLYNNNSHDNEYNKGRHSNRRHESELNFDYLNSEMSDSSFHSQIKSPAYNYNSIPLNNAAFKGYEIIIKNQPQTPAGKSISPSKKTFFYNPNAIENILTYGLNMNLVLDNLLFNRDNNMFEQEELDNLCKYLRKYFKSELVSQLYDKNAEQFNSAEKLKYVFLLNYIDSYLNKNKGTTDITNLEFIFSEKKLIFQTSFFLSERMKKILLSLNVKHNIDNIESERRFRVTIMISENLDKPNKNLGVPKDFSITPLATFTNEPKQINNIIGKLIKAESGQNLPNQTITEEDLFEGQFVKAETLAERQIQKNAEKGLELTFKKKADNTVEEDENIEDFLSKENVQDQKMNTKCPYKIKSNTFGNELRENRITCHHANVLVFSTSSLLQYMKVIDTQLSNKHMTSKLYKDLEEFTKVLPSLLIESKHCPNGLCLRTLIIELVEINQKEQIMKLLEKIELAEYQSKKSMTKILLRWEKIEYDEFNKNFNFVFRLPLTLSNIQTICGSVEV